MAPPPAKEGDAGLNFVGTDFEPHPSGPPQHEGMSQAERIFTAGSTFISGVLAINASQFLGVPLKLIGEDYFDGYIAFTKKSFAVLVTSMTQWWSPTVVRISGDKSVQGQITMNDDGTLKCNFPHRIILMANHQLYTDWLYLWWMAYTNGMHGRIYIILKESLRKIPIFGWGAQFYNFIFLARKWETDKARFQEHLQKLNNPADPMWLLIFPEGTNLSATTREASARWAAKNRIPDMKHQLLPRSTGLRFCCEELKGTTSWLYDCTIAYEGIPPGEFGQDIFTLRSSMFEGRPPKSVNMHWRRFPIEDIPTHSEKAFEVWLRNRWTEKDHLLDFYVKNGYFPSEDPWKRKPGQKLTRAKTIETQVKSSSWEEFLSIFAPITAFITVLFLFYGASKSILLGPNSKEAMEQQAALAKEALSPKGNVKPATETQLAAKAPELKVAETTSTPIFKVTPKAPSPKPAAGVSSKYKGSQPIGTVKHPQGLKQSFKPPKVSVNQATTGKVLASAKPAVSKAAAPAKADAPVSKPKHVNGTITSKPQVDGAIVPKIQRRQSITSNASTIKNKPRKLSSASLPVPPRMGGRAGTVVSAPISRSKPAVKVMSTATGPISRKAPAAKAPSVKNVPAAPKSVQNGVAPHKKPAEVPTVKVGQSTFEKMKAANKPKEVPTYKMDQATIEKLKGNNARKTKEIPTYKMDQATIDKLKATNK